jgi:hypothetical protein
MYLVIDDILCAILTHGHTGQLPGGIARIGSHANLCMVEVPMQ